MICEWSYFCSSLWAVALFGRVRAAGTDGVRCLRPSGFSRGDDVGSARPDRQLQQRRSFVSNDHKNMFVLTGGRIRRNSHALSTSGIKSDVVTTTGTFALRMYNRVKASKIPSASTPESWFQVLPFYAPRHANNQNARDRDRGHDRTTRCVSEGIDCELVFVLNARERTVAPTFFLSSDDLSLSQCT